MSVETVGATGAKVLVSQTFMAFEEPWYVLIVVGFKRIMPQENPWRLSSLLGQVLPSEHNIY